MTRHVVVLPGDGIGVEVTQAAITVLKSVAQQFGVTVETEEHLAGGASIDECGLPITDEALQACKKADAVFLGAVGGPKWDDFPKDQRPEIALLRLRKELGLYTNLRPVTVFEPLLEASSLKPEVIRGTDILIVRELTGGLYFGVPKYCKQVGSEEVAVDTMQYSTSEIDRIARVAFEAAALRRGKVTSVDKANILATSQLWRKTVSSVSQDFSGIEIEHMLVDNCAMQIVRNPKQFDVILTENTFGDILSDEASMLTGSLGMLPSASLGTRGGLYEPVHGTAPDIAGKNLANPLAAIGSVALMLRYTFKMVEAAQAIEAAIQSVLDDGLRSADIAANGGNVLGTDAMAREVLSRARRTCATSQRPTNIPAA